MLKSSEVEDYLDIGVFNLKSFEKFKFNYWSSQNEDSEGKT
jgi:hypothetical protein